MSILRKLAREAEAFRSLKTDYARVLLWAASSRFGRPRFFHPKPSGIVSPSGGIVVGVPVYNGGKYLAAAMESLLGQSLGSFRIVVVNDGSTDDSDGILRGFAARDGRIHYECLPRRTGMIRAWRRTAELAWDLYRPAYFAWCSDHDELEPRWLEALRGAFDRDEGLSLAHPATGRSSEEGPSLSGSYDGLDTAGRGLLERIDLATRPRAGAGDAVYGLFKMEDLMRCGVFRGEVFPDRLLISEINLHGGVRYVPEVLRRRRMVWFSDQKASVLGRQARSLFPEGHVLGKTPVVSHVTRFLRDAFERPKGSAGNTPLSARHLHAWCYFARQSWEFRGLLAEELGREGISLDAALSALWESSSPKRNLSEIRSEVAAFSRTLRSKAPARIATFEETVGK